MRICCCRICLLLASSCPLPNHHALSTHPLSTHTQQQEHTKMKTFCLVASLASVGAFMVGNPLSAAPKTTICSSTTRMAVALPPLPCKYSPYVYQEEQNPEQQRHPVF